MAKNRPATVTARLKKAGAAALASAPEMPLEELAKIVYRTMRAADIVPVYRTTPVKHAGFDDVFLIGQELRRQKAAKKKPPKGNREKPREAMQERGRRS